MIKALANQQLSNNVATAVDEMTRQGPFLTTCHPHLPASTPPYSNAKYNCTRTNEVQLYCILVFNIEEDFSSSVYEDNNLQGGRRQVVASGF